MELHFRIKLSLIRKLSGYELPAISKWHNAVRRLNDKRMKKQIYLMISILFLNCNGISEKQDFEKAKISDEIFTQYSEFENLFVCKDSMEDFDNGYAKIELNTDNLKILNFKNNGYESTKVEIEINKNLKIETVKYSYGDDVVDGSKTEYAVINAKININKNPFEQDSQQFAVYYLLKIRETNIPSEFWRFKKETEYYFKGKIECR